MLNLAGADVLATSAYCSPGPIFIKVLAHLHLKPVYEFLRYAYIYGFLIQYVYFKSKYTYKFLNLKA